MSKSHSSYNPAAGVCSPAVLLQLACPKYYEFLRINCMLGRYKTKKGDELTILIPDDKRLALMEKMTEAQELVSEVESLIIPQKINHVSSFASGFVTKSGVSIAVSKASEKEAVLENGCKLTPIKFNSRYHYFVGYRLSGTAKLSGEPGSVSDKAKKGKKGGGFAVLSGPQSFMQKVQKKTERLYKNPYSENEGLNIYFKKVYLQLRILKKHNSALFASGEILNHLGNEEITTSYLLDMITDDECAEALYNCLGQDGPCPDRLKNVGFAEFAAEYNSVLAAAPPPARALSADSQSAEVHKVQNHLDARIYCRSIYQDNLNRLGKDLFIIFSNHKKYGWLKRRKECIERDGSFENLDNTEYESYVFYVKWNVANSDISTRARNPPNVEDDFRDYVGLIKTDVLLFVPQKFSTTGTTLVDTHGLEVVSSLPSLDDRKLYSMNEYMARLSQTGGIYLGGGKSKVHDALDQYI